MIDLIKFQNGDLRFQDTNLKKAASVMETQLGSLEYLPEFGCDYNYFLKSDISFQAESLRSHIIEKLSQNLVPVNTIDELKQNLENILKIGIAKGN